MEAGSVLRVRVAQAFGHEPLDGLADELAARVTEEPLGLGIDQDDPA